MDATRIRVDTRNLAAHEECFILRCLVVVWPEAVAQFLGGEYIGRKTVRGSMLRTLSRDGKNKDDRPFLLCLLSRSPDGGCLVAGRFTNSAIVAVSSAFIILECPETMGKACLVRGWKRSASCRVINAWCWIVLSAGKTYLCQSSNLMSIYV